MYTNHLIVSPSHARRRRRSRRRRRRSRVPRRSRLARTTPRFIFSGCVSALNISEIPRIGSCHAYVIAPRHRRQYRSALAAGVRKGSSSRDAASLPFSHSRAIHADNAHARAHTHTINARARARTHTAHRIARVHAPWALPGHPRTVPSSHSTRSRTFALALARAIRPQPR